MFSLATIRLLNERAEKKRAYDRQYHAERRQAAKLANAEADRLAWENCAKPFWVVNGIITDVNPANI